MKNCVTSEVTLANSFLSLSPVQDQEVDPVAELTNVRVEQEAKLQRMWRDLGLIEEKVHSEG